MGGDPVKLLFLRSRLLKFILLENSWDIPPDKDPDDTISIISKLVLKVNANSCILFFSIRN